MTDDQSASTYHPGRVRAGPLSAGGDDPATGEGASASPAEVGFPYIATQGIQPGTGQPPQDPEPGGPPLRNRSPAARGRAWVPVVIGLASGLFVLAVLGAYLVWGPSGNPIAGPSTPPAPDATASGAVRGYLQALAAGDADAALGFAATPPSDSSLLTDQVLAAALKDAPLSAIEVVESTDDAGRQYVSARYRLGDREISTIVEVVQQDAVWRLPAVATTVDVGALRMQEVPLTINGQPVASPTPALFPGRYTIGTTAERYAVASPEFTVDELTEQPPLMASLTLSDAGHAEIVAAATSHLTACVERHELDPADCGFAIASPKGTKLKESTMRWSVRSGAGRLDEMEPVLDHPGSATAAVNIVVHGKVRGTDGSRWQASVRLTRMRADLTGEKVTVQFA